MKKHSITYIAIPIIVILLSSLIFNETITAQDKSISNEASIKGAQFNTLVWSDEFDGIGAVDAEKWFHQTQLPPGGSWWGGLIQHYTNRIDNSYLENGFLNLVAKKKYLMTRVK